MFNFGRFFLFCKATGRDLAFLCRWRAFLWHKYAIAWAIFQQSKQKSVQLQYYWVLPFGKLLGWFTLRYPKLLQFGRLFLSILGLFGLLFGSFMCSSFRCQWTLLPLVWWGKYVDNEQRARSARCIMSSNQQTWQAIFCKRRKKHRDALQYNEFQKPLGHFAIQWVSKIIGTLCIGTRILQCGSSPLVNVDSMQIIKTSASQQKTEQTRQQQVNHQHIPIKACQKYSSHGPGINIDKGGEGGGRSHEAATTV